MLTRRSLLSAGAAAAGGIALTGCGPRGTQPGTTAGTGQLPTYTPLELAAPDLPGTPQGVAPGYFSYPASPAPAAPPVTGNPIDVLTYTFDPIAPDLPANRYWQNLNAAIGTELRINYTPSADYRNRFSTTIAGGDIPDVVAIQGTVQQMPAMLAATFTDLSDLLGGDAVKAYPNLATLPTDAWRSTMYNGRIWGIPVPRSIIGTVLYTRADLLTAKGLSLEPANHTEFVEMAKALTDARAARWAFGQLPFGALLEMNGVTGSWTVSDDGIFTHQATTDGYRQALEDAVALQKLGVVHPDGAAAQNTTRNDWFINGTTAFTIGGYAGWTKYYQLGADIDQFRVTGMLSPTRDGQGQPVRAPGMTSASFSAISRGADDTRLQQILQVLNWLNAPFGSADYLTRRFGQADTTYRLDGSDPVAIPEAAAQTTLPVRYVAESSPVIYEPGRRQAVEDQHAHQVAGVPLVVPNPTLGLYSETAASKAATAQKEVDTALQEILLGNQPTNTWPAVIDSYMQQVGNQIKGEYEQQYAVAR